MIREYQVSSAPARAYSPMRSRYEPMAYSRARWLNDRVQPSDRPAMTKLAASRLVSHSNGPGSVSSKSLRSNTSDRSGER